MFLTCPRPHGASLVQQLECSLCPKQDPCDRVVVVGTGVVVVVVVVVVVGVVITVVVVVVVVATGPIGEPSLTQKPEQDGLELHWARHWEWAPEIKIHDIICWY